MKSRSQTPLLRPPGAVVEITRDLERAGFEAWCVGGAVRDALLGHAHLDWDLATNATPDQVKQVFGRKRTIPVGIAFGTVGVLDAGGVLHEVTTFRRDVRTDGRHAEVEFGASLDEDLARRDFTVNAIAYSPRLGTLHDPYGGQADLERRIVRAVGDPDERMREDRLRALRGIRFAARLGFDIEKKTWEAIAASAPHLTRLSAERVRQEVEKTLDQVTEPSSAFRRWRDAGALAVLIPELADVSDEALRAVDRAARPVLPGRPVRRLVRLAALFSDLGGAGVMRVATRLRFSKHDGQWLGALVDRWRALDPVMSARVSGLVEPAEVRRWIATIGRLDLGAFFRLAEAHWQARRELRGVEGAPPARAVQRLYRRSLRAALTEPVDLRDLAVDGDDLRSAGITPGPALGKILSALLDAVIADPRVNTRERLLELARGMDAAR
ncbi:MAG TPA: CCA tRNA nucleotidyltransferase [Gemmatimonadaceae bacterium]|nr:CCA tRNA nucleotidyltransferase [Gemmatimonadaceae bacterium]